MVDKVVAIQFLEKDVKIIIESPPFPDGKLRPEEDEL